MRPTPAPRAPAPAPPPGVDVEHPGEPFELEPALDVAEPNPTREAWRPWQIAVLVAVGLLVGLLAGVVLGARLTDDDGDPNAVGSRSDPVELGDAKDVGSGWQLRVLEVDADAGAAIAELRDANEPPGPNESYVLVTLQLAFTPRGNELYGQPQNVLLSLVDERGTEYLPHERPCGLFPNAVFTYPAVEPGGEITANQCWAVPTDKLPGMRLLVATRTSTNYFALR